MYQLRLHSVLTVNTIWHVSTVSVLLCGKFAVTLIQPLMIQTTKNQPPSHPGEILQKRFLAPGNITQRELSDALHVPYQRINELINQKRGITPSTALRLARFFGMTPDFWLNLQMQWDLHKVAQSEKREIEKIQAHHQ